MKLAAMRPLIFCLLVFLGWAAPLAGQGFFYDSLFFDSAAKRAEDLPKLGPLGAAKFPGPLASSFTANDSAILKLAQDNGIKRVIYMTNTGSMADHRKQWDAFPGLEFDYNVVDDADQNGMTPEKLKALVGTVTPQLRPGMGTFASFTRNADPAAWANITTHVHLQAYIYHEGGLKKWGWDLPKAWKAAHTKGDVYVGPYLGKNVPVFFGVFPKYPDGRPAPPQPWWTESIFTPIGWNEAQAWMGICLGCKVLYYSAHSISPTIPTSNYRLCDYPRHLASYGELNRQMKEAERFTAVVKPVQFESADGRYVGATWTLPTGESLKVTIDTNVDMPKAIPVVTPVPKPVPAVVTPTATGFLIDYARP